MGPGDTRPRILAVAVWRTLRDLPKCWGHRKWISLREGGQNGSMQSQITRVSRTISLVNSLKFPYVQTGNKITLTQSVWKWSVAWLRKRFVNCKSHHHPKKAVLLVSCDGRVEEYGGWEQAEEVSGQMWAEPGRKDQWTNCLDREGKKKSRNIKRSEKRGECWDPRTLDNTGDSSEAI